MNLTLNTNDYEKWRIRRDNNNGNNGVNAVPTQNNGIVPGSAADFELKYGPSIFGVDPNNIAPSGVERFNIAGANAGTAGAPNLVPDNNSNTSIWNQTGDFTNPTIQTGGPTAVGVVPLATPVALPAATGNDPTGKQGGATEGQPEQQGPTFSASDIFALTGGLTVTNPAPPPPPPANEAPPSEPEPTGEATLTATNPEEVGEGEGIGDNPEVKELGEPDEEIEPTDTSNPDNITGNNDENSGVQNTTNTVKEDKKAAEAAAKKAAEEREEEQKAA